MRKIASVSAFLFLAVAEACGGPANLLIGNWKLVSGATGCSTSMNYTAKSLTQVDWQGQTSTIAVTYVAGDATKFPTTVYVITDAGMAYHTTWIFSSKDKVQLDAYTMCTYQRQ